MKKNIDWIVLSILGVFCYLYSMFSSYFAELHLKLSFLNFPIFVGEMLLAFCVVMLFVKWKNYPIKLNRWYYLLITYILFILVKAFHGYYKEGPLAFRNAALFYYFLFAVIGYYFYNSNFFKNRFIVFSSLFLLISSFIFTQAYKTFYFNYLIFIAIFLMGIKNKKARYISIVLVLIIGYQGILVTFRGGRNILVSSSIAYMFIFITFISSFIKAKTRYKMGGLLIVLFLSSFIIWNFSGDKIAIKSLLSLKEFSTVYKDYLKEISIREKNFKFANPPVKLYEDNFDYNPEPYFENKFKSMIDAVTFNVKRDSANRDKLNFVTDSFSDKEKIAAILEKVDKTILVKYIQESATENQPIPFAGTLYDRKKLATTLVDNVQKSVVENQSISSTGTLSDGERMAAIFEKVNKDVLVNIIQKSVVESQPVFHGGKLPDGDKMAAVIEKVNKVTLVKNIKEFILESQPKRIRYNYGERNLGEFQLSLIYRLFIYTDMFEDIVKNKKIFGANFGKPFHPKKLQLVRFDEGWKTRVGWVEPHNGYVHMIYRSGIIGLSFIIVIGVVFLRMVKLFIKIRNFKGILLSAALLYWLIISNFMVILELPHWSIPFWSLLGMTLKYSHIQREKILKGN